MENRKIESDKKTFQVVIGYGWKKTLKSLGAEHDMNIRELVEEALQNHYGEYHEEDANS